MMIMIDNGGNYDDGSGDGGSGDDYDDNYDNDDDSPARNTFDYVVILNAWFVFIM